MVKTQQRVGRFHRWRRVRPSELVHQDAPPPDELARAGGALAFVRNRRLADALTLWAFWSLTASPGARAFYDRNRGIGDSQYQTLQALANRWVGLRHGCLRHRTCYDEQLAWPTATTPNSAAA